jgi:hypothetical protein
VAEFPKDKRALKLAIGEAWVKAKFGAGHIPGKKKLTERQLLACFKLWHKENKVAWRLAHAVLESVLETGNCVVGMKQLGDSSTKVFYELGEGRYIARLLNLGTKGVQPRADLPEFIKLLCKTIG